MATDAEILDSFSSKIATIQDDLTYLKNHVIPSTDINSQGKLTTDLGLLNELSSETEKLKQIEARYRNATDIWIT
jgi:hypothetical protein